ncbi:MAG: hypothetical protein WA869_24365 [Alloacidobacterium sp.]
MAFSGSRTNAKTASHPGGRDTTRAIRGYADASSSGSGIATPAVRNSANPPPRNCLQWSTNTASSIAAACKPGASRRAPVYNASTVAGGCLSLLRRLAAEAKAARATVPDDAKLGYLTVLMTGLGSGARPDTATSEVLLAMRG